MNYKEAILYLEKSCKFGSKQGHENFRRLMALFDNPQEKLKIIHVAGTNGKGSACAMISSVLKSEGYRVGVFTSPHLEKYNEIVLPQALELADLIFQNNYDKIYFLRQYLKSFETSTQELEKANTFVKRNKK